ncbi:hypothetical protein [Corynebacterium sp.]|uniref:hypothetical protein n=1 Tax=Corynebacterium sp. TaxID=1720 RepID=UPI0028AC3DE7|nr:hypothetical protein [Corynebacterium sp.]
MTPAEVISALQLIVAIVAVVVAVATIRQKRRADNRAAWWARLQWTLDKITSPDEDDQMVGFRLLPVVTEASLDSPDDKQLAKAIKELGDDLTTEDDPSNPDDDPVDSEPEPKEEP